MAVAADKTGVVESEDGTLSSAARASKHEAPDNSVGNSGDDVSPAPEGTPVDAPGQPEGEKLHEPGKPHTAGNPIARAVIHDVRHLVDHIEGKDVEAEQAAAAEAQDK